ncbi:MAG: nucleotidyltransferase family protein [Sulfuricurvum sp.]|nr:nucleotidyltransferase family protein [Sulfuricurvum sp.]
MTNLKDITVKSTITIREALLVIDKGSKQIALIVDESDKLIGTLNDGDIRRGLIKGCNLSDSIEKIYFKNPTIANINDSREAILRTMTSKKILQIPLVDNNGVLVGLKNLDELVNRKNKSNKVILMVGGLGTRLRPLTDDTPKPMLHVGNKPILQTIVEKFAEYGYCNIIMCVNYKSQIIQNYFGDGSMFGVNISYILEEQRMGTAGALSLLPEIPSEPFFVMNGDLLTNVNFEHLHDYHLANHAQATMCVREYDFQVPYGVVNIEENKILSIVEKPLHKFFVSAGIYMFDPKVIQNIPTGKFYDMPALFEHLISQREPVLSFALHEYWLDIGRINDYEQANNEYDKIF